MIGRPDPPVVRDAIDGRAVGGTGHHSEAGQHGASAKSVSLDVGAHGGGSGFDGSNAREKTGEANGCEIYGEHVLFLQRGDFACVVGCSFFGGSYAGTYCDLRATINNPLTPRNITSR